MDGLDSFDNVDSGADGQPSAAPEAPKESPEKQRERASKAIAGIQKSRRDEGRARKHSDMLAHILVELLKDPKYDRITDLLLVLLRGEVPSVAVLGFAAISYAPALRALVDHLALAVRVPVLSKREVAEPFDDRKLLPEEREYINLWIEVLFGALTSEHSVLLTKKLISQLGSPFRNDILQAMARFFEFFLADVGLQISPDGAEAYAGFILDQVEKRLRQTKLEEF